MVLTYPIESPKPSPFLGSLTPPLQWCERVPQNAHPEMLVMPKVMVSGAGLLAGIGSHGAAFTEGIGAVIKPLLLCEDTARSWQ